MINYTYTRTGYFIKFLRNVPNLDINDKENMISLFNKINIAFNKINTIQRKNFFEYQYVFYKICLMLNKPEFIINTPNMNINKYIKYEILWNIIIDSMNE